MVTFWDRVDQVVLPEFGLHLRKHAVHTKQKREESIIIITSF